MNWNFMTDGEIAAFLGERVRAYRVSSSGVAMTREQAAISAGVSLSALERLEKGGNPRLLTIISVLREFGLLDGLGQLVPDVSGPTPMEIVNKVRQDRRRAYAPRGKKGGDAPTEICKLVVA